jgi:hypothetical protein
MGVKGDKKGKLLKLIRKNNEVLIEMDGVERFWVMVWK